MTHKPTQYLYLVFPMGTGLPTTHKAESIEFLPAGGVLFKAKDANGNLRVTQAFASGTWREVRAQDLNA